jgi:hypothetical protein
MVTVGQTETATRLDSHDLDNKMVDLEVVALDRDIDVLDYANSFGPKWHYRLRSFGFYHTMKAEQGTIRAPTKYLPKRPIKNPRAKAAH